MNLDLICDLLRFPLLGLWGICAEDKLSSYKTNHLDLTANQGERIVNINLNFSFYKIIVEGFIIF